MSKYKEKDAIEDNFTKTLCSILNLDKTIFKTKHNVVYVDDEQYLDAVKTYVYQKVRLIFDPPTNSAHIAALENLTKEFEFRLNVEAESNN